MIVTDLTRQGLSIRREQRDLTRLGYRRHETDWEIHRGGRQKENIIDARISVCGGYVYTLLSGVAPPQPAQAQVSAIQLREIARQVQTWIDWSKERRDQEGLSTDADTNIMSLPVPYWPGHGQMENWIKALSEAADQLAGQDKEDTGQ